MTISNRMTVVGLVNGMIGGIILVMPLLSEQAGWLFIAPITFISGFFSYFTCLLCLRHLKHYSNLDVAIYYHFDKQKKYKIFYDVIIIISMTTLLILYFSLICQQWQGLTQTSKIIPIVNALALFPIVYIMKKFDFGASLLAYGILSIVGYVIFLTWNWIDTEPGPKTLPAGDPKFIDLAAALGQGFAIQTFFIPILKKNGNRKLYKKLLALTYIIGSLVYCYIGYSGAFSIINRNPFKGQPQTIEDYFGKGQWQVMVVQIIYLIHLYSAFPQFLLIAKQRFFSIFRWPQTKDVTIKEVIYVGVTILLSLLVKLTGMKITLIIELNGSIISFFFIYVIPIGLHLKCVYFSHGSAKKDQLAVTTDKAPKQPIQMMTIEQNREMTKPFDLKLSNDIYGGDKNFPEITQPNTGDSSDMKETLNDNQTMEPHNQGQIEESQYQKDESCCDTAFKSKFHEYCELGIIGIMVLVGIGIMIYTLVLMGMGESV